ncbi:MAG: hypothetical protein IT373_21960 [Polyangiaceae bacterium]|nr:hypothetical protein [Polyangiaceae bacterium]
MARHEPRASASVPCSRGPRAQAPSRRALGWLCVAGLVAGLGACGKKDEPPPSASAATAAPSASGKGAVAPTAVGAEGRGALLGDTQSAPAAKRDGAASTDDDDKDVSAKATSRRLVNVARSWRKASKRLQGVIDSFVPPVDPDKPALRATVDGIRTRAQATVAKADDLLARLGGAQPGDGTTAGPAPELDEADTEAPDSKLGKRLEKTSELLAVADARLGKIIETFVPPVDPDKPALRAAIAVLKTEATSVLGKTTDLLAKLDPAPR